MIVYNLWNEGLGDHIASICLLAQLSIARQQPVSFASRRPNRVIDILDLLDLGKADLDDQTGDGNTDLSGFDVWATEYLPTKVRWHRPRATRYICTHFDGISSAEDKNPSPEEAAQIVDWACQRGLGVVALTQNMSLSRVVNLLSRCTLFVGCDSGMSHLAHCVGCPTYLLQYKLPVVTCHRHKAYVRCDGAGHFTQQGDNWLSYLKFLS